MLRRDLLVAAPLLALAFPAAAATSNSAGGVGQYVDLQPVGLPIVVKGRLVNYVFVYVRLNLTAAANAAALREKEPFFRDALVRTATRTPFTDPADYNRIDPTRLAAAMTPQAAAIAGPGAIASVVILSQAPQHHVATPHGG